jgi:hypothetical protein
MAKVNNQVLFFILIFVLFYIAVKMANLSIEKMNTQPEVSYILGAVIYTLAIYGIYNLAGLANSSEGFWDVSQYAQCKGGPYFWQGDSPNSKRCRELASTPEGRCGISSYNCPTGYVGTPKLPFYYTPLSDAEWKNEQCEDIPQCPCTDVGLCGMQKQVE